MFQVQLEKLNFIVEEIHLAHSVAIHVSDQFLARTLARHIIVRAENFIQHARKIRKPLNNAGFNTRQFHSSKETYAKEFDEYLKDARHKLGAHIQDLDFGRRIELWNDIEVIKIGFFVEGAREIYESLSSLNIPGYSSFVAPTELPEDRIVELLSRIQNCCDSYSFVELGADPLALTRENTVSLLNSTPIHSRAAQLTLIHRWISMQRELFELFRSFTCISRIIKERLITDIVSYCDCLITRRVTQGSPQEMDGLDVLIRDASLSSEVIDTFVSSSNFNAECQNARLLRDRIGAHLEIDESVSLSELLSSLDSYNLDKCLQFYDRTRRTFTKTCRNILFLQPYLSDGQRINGVSASRISSVPYSGNTQSTRFSNAPSAPTYSDDEFMVNLANWHNGDKGLKESARGYFYEAFTHSAAIETLVENEELGGGVRIRRHEYRKAHKFIENILTSATTDYEFQSIVRLGVSCRNGYPYQLAEMLARRHHDNAPFRQVMICSALGDIADLSHNLVTQYLEKYSSSEIWPVRLHSLLARYKIFVRSEGLYRVNHHDHERASYDSFVSSLRDSIPDLGLFICNLAFASVHKCPDVAGLSHPFNDDYLNIQSEIKKQCETYLIEKNQLESVEKLLAWDDYTGVALLIALQQGEEGDLYWPLIDSCINGSIAVAGHEQALCNLATCYLLRAEYDKAIDIVSQIAFSNPDCIEDQIRLAEFLATAPGEEQVTLSKICEIRENYTLTPGQAQSLTGIEDAISGAC
ncbi:MAG: hypothetical protein ACJA1I_000202 [Zhongshania marina]|jgi:hypothetical protein